MVVHGEKDPEGPYFLNVESEEFFRKLLSWGLGTSVFSLLVLLMVAGIATESRGPFPWKSVFAVAIVGWLGATLTLVRLMNLQWRSRRRIVVDAVELIKNAEGFSFSHAKHKGRTIGNIMLETLSAHIAEVKELERKRRAADYDLMEKKFPFKKLPLLHKLGIIGMNALGIYFLGFGTAALLGKLPPSPFAHSTDPRIVLLSGRHDKILGIVCVEMAVGSFLIGHSFRVRTVSRMKEAIRELIGES